MPIAGTLAELHEWLGAIHPVILVVVAALAVSLETSLFIGLLVPGDVILLVAGTQASTPGRFAAILGAGVVGSLLGESVGYAMGRRYGAKMRNGRLGRRIGVERWDAAAERLRANGARAIVIARFTPVVHALLPLLAGAARVPYRHFISWCTIAAVAWSTVYVSVGALAGAHLDRLHGSLGMLGYLIVGAVAAVIAGKRLRRHRAARREQLGDPPVDATTPTSGTSKRRTAIDPRTPIQLATTGGDR